MAMFGPTGRPPFGGRRRVRRRVAAAAAGLAVLGLVIGELAVQVERSGAPSSRRASASYVAAASPLLEESAQLAPVLRALRQDGPTMQRQALEAELALLRQASSQEEAAGARLSLAPPSRAAASLLGAVLEDRSAGVRLVAAGLEAAMGPDGPGLAQALRDLEAAGRRLLAADAAYRRLLETLPGGAGALPRGGWIAAPSAWRPAALASWARALASSPTLRAQPALQILAVSLQPPPVRVRGLAPPVTTTTTPTTSTATTTTSTASATGPSPTKAPTTTTSSRGHAPTPPSTTVAPTTSTLQLPPAGSVAELAGTATVRVAVVVRNAGNVALSGVRVRAALAELGRAAVVASTAEVRSLAAGGSRYLLVGPLDVRTGARYELTVRAAAEGAVAKVALRLDVVR